MSRTNPQKKKRRQAKRTLLVLGEGLGEKVFLDHLKALYSYDNNIDIKIIRGKGGSADRIVADTDKIPGDYDRKVVVLDNDKAEAEMKKARQDAKKKGIELIENTPCLEHMFLLILDKKANGKNSTWCKNEFESNYIREEKRGDKNECQKLFPKELLEEQRLKIPELDRLISLMEGK